MQKLKITQIKSPIGREKSQKLTLISLGLNKLNKEKIVEGNDSIKGMINKVKHLLKIRKWQMLYGQPQSLIRNN